MTEPITKSESIGRNEPCPCGSGKKYKRCCGVNAAPKLSVPSQPAGIPTTGAPGFDPAGAFGNMDPQMMMQFSQALQRLPKGQLQRLQAIMQKAMNGRDVTAEAEEFEKSLPVDFQNMLQSFKMPLMAEMASAMNDSSAPATETGTSAMTEEQARALVAKAAAEGAISKEQADSLLKAAENTAQSETMQNSNLLENKSDLTESAQAETEDKSSKLGKFWRNIAGKKNQ